MIAEARQLGGPVQLITHSMHIAARTIRESLRQPGVEVTNVFIPLFFLAVTTAAVSDIIRAGIGIENYIVFQLPVAVLQAVAGSSSASGIAIVTDMERGYFDKLLLTPASRWSIIIGRVSADAVRAIFFSAIMLIVTIAVSEIQGDGMAGGAGAIILILLIAGLFGAAYSGIGIFVAMRTANAQAAQASFLLFFPLLFMAPAFAPIDNFDGWLQAIATVNPVTYIMEGIRGITLDGYEGESLLWTFVSLAGFGAVTLTMAALSLRSRAAVD